MKKENWLSPITKEDVAEFVRSYMGLQQITTLEEAQDETYGKFFQVRGLIQDSAAAGWKKSVKLMREIALGEYGPIDADPYKESTADDLNKLFSEDENLINIYLAWISLVSSKNQGRTINGKTYSESFSNACNAQIDLTKTAQMRKIENEASEKKGCVKSFVEQLENNKASELQ